MTDQNARTPITLDDAKGRWVAASRVAVAARELADLAREAASGSERSETQIPRALVALREAVGLLERRQREPMADVWLAILSDGFAVAVGATPEAAEAAALDSFRRDVARWRDDPEARTAMWGSAQPMTFEEYAADMPRRFVRLTGTADAIYAFCQCGAGAGPSELAAVLGL